VNITVLGATGGIGAAITRELTTRGHAVTAASRSVTADGLPAGARALPTDLTDPAAAARAVRGSDVVVMAAQVPYPRWHDELVPLFDRALEAAASEGARLVVVDNLYAYGVPAGPITDATPEAASTRKGALRRDLAARLLAAHEAGRARVTIGRFSDYFGGDGTNSLIHMLGTVRVLAGKAPQVFIDGDQPHTFAYLPDAARGFATLVERPEADGRAWVLPATHAVTQRELLTDLAALAGLPPKLGRIGPAALWVGGLFDAALRETREMTPAFARPYVTRADDFVAAFGPITLTPHREALRATLATARAAAGAGTGAAPAAV
jgi:nucleoside-diphosphate-sugar epimerase